MGVGEGLSGPRGGLGGEAKLEVAYCMHAQEDSRVGGTEFLWLRVRASRGREEG